LIGRPGPYFGPVALLSALLLGTPSLAAPADGAKLAAIRENLRKGDRVKALEAARAAIAESPDDVECHLLYQDAARGQLPLNHLQNEYRARWEQKKGADTACLYARLLPAAECEKMLAEAVAADGKSYWGLVGLAEAQARLGKAPAAEASALAALGLRAGDVAAATRAGDQCAFARRYPAAEACYRKAVEASASDANAKLGLALAILRQARPDEAAAAIAPLRSAAKPDPRVLLLEAAIAAEKGNPVEAEKLLGQAMALNPGDFDAGLQLALLHLRKADAIPRPPGKGVDKRSVAADVALLEKAAAALPERAEFRYALGFAHEVTGNVEGAMEDYREASRLDPLDGDVVTAIGALLVAKGQIEEAGREFMNALDRNPDDAGAMFQLGFVLDQQGKFKESVPVYQRLVKAQPADPRAWCALGAALNSLNRPKEAATAFQKAVDLAPNSARFLRDLGEAQYESKQWTAAEASLLKATEYDPKDGNAWTGLARARTQLRKYAPAAEAYEKAAELRPKDAELQILLGAYYQEFLKDPEKALQHYNRYLTLGGDAADVEEWMDEAQAELDRKKKK
jgi:tetratricopeptide (TPR) repeat protein